MTEADIAALAQGGVTHVRIPVGYWIVDILPTEPFVPGGWAYLVAALAWVKQYNMSAVIDLHGLLIGECFPFSHQEASCIFSSLHSVCLYASRSHLSCCALTFLFFSFCCSFCSL